MPNLKRCKDCGNHHGSQFCPDVKSIKYYANGNIEQIEYYPTTDKLIESNVRSRLEVEIKKLQESARDAKKDTTTKSAT